MRYRMPAAALAVVLLAGSLAIGRPALAAGGMGIPSSGSVGAGGLFLACRSTTSSPATTPYYDQQNVLTTWDCGEGMRPHKGVDIIGSSTPGATPVFAPAPGIVWTSERGNGLGWRVVLRHGQNFGDSGRFVYTIFGHMGDCETGASFIDAAVTPGAAVTAGQLLGHQGTDGFPAGCSTSHLHWEVRASDTDVTNVFLATPASPNFYTGVQLTADDPNPVTSVTATVSSGGTITPPPGSGGTITPPPSDGGAQPPPALPNFGALFSGFGSGQGGVSNLFSMLFGGLSSGGFDLSALFGSLFGGGTGGTGWLSQFGDAQQQQPTESSGTESSGTESSGAEFGFDEAGDGS